MVTIGMVCYPNMVRVNGETPFQRKHGRVKWWDPTNMVAILLLEIDPRQVGYGR